MYCLPYAVWSDGKEDDIMKNLKTALPKSIAMVFVLTVVCGMLYTAFVTLVAQVFFPNQANGSIIEVNGTKYGCELLAQQFSDKTHMWGRVMNVDTSTFVDEDGTPLLYAQPSNLSPKSDEFQEIVADRVAMILESNPDAKVNQIPEDLVTCSGSGLDPDISVAAAEYQVPRLAEENNMTEKEVEDIVEKCTTHKLLGILGENTVNVLKVNLMLEGIL